LITRCCGEAIPIEFRRRPVALREAGVEQHAHGVATLFRDVEVGFSVVVANGKGGGAPALLARFNRATGEGDELDETRTGADL